MEREEEADRDPGEDRVDAEEVAEVAGVRLVGVDGDAVEEARERDAPEKRSADRADRVHPRPERPPAGALGLPAPFEREHAHDQERQDQEEGEVEAREHRRVPDRERGERRPAGDHEPDLVPVPQRPDRLEHRAPVGLAPAEDGQQHADAEVEALQHEVAGPEEGEQAEPEDLERHLSTPAPVAAPPPRPRARPREDRAGHIGASERSRRPRAPRTRRRTRPG